MEFTRRKQRLLLLWALEIAIVNEQAFVDGFGDSHGGPKYYAGLAASDKAALKRTRQAIRDMKKMHASIARELKRMNDREEK